MILAAPEKWEVAKVALHPGANLGFALGTLTVRNGIWATHDVSTIMDPAWVLDYRNRCRQHNY